MQAVTLDKAMSSNICMLRISQGKIRLITWSDWRNGSFWFEPEDIADADEFLEKGDLDEFYYQFSGLDEDNFVGFSPEQVIFMECYDGNSRFVRLGRYLMLVIKDNEGSRYKIWDLRIKLFGKMLFKAATIFANLIGPTRPDST